MKKINKVSLASANSDLMDIIREASYLENLANTGKTPDGILSLAKDKLNLEDGQSVIVEFEGKVSNINKIQKNFIDTNSLTDRLIDANMITDDEVKVLNGIEDRIADMLLEVFDINKDNLYLEE